MVSPDESTAHGEDEAPGNLLYRVSALVYFPSKVTIQRTFEDRYVTMTCHGQRQHTEPTRPRRGQLQHSATAEVGWTSWQTVLQVSGGGFLRSQTFVEVS